MSPRDLNNLAALLQDHQPAGRGRTADAPRPGHRRDRASGQTHPTVARDLNNLAQLLQATNRLAEAEPLIRRALDSHEHSFGKDHPTVARALNNLAGLLKPPTGSRRPNR